MKPGWRTSPCVVCRGYGLVSDYDFHGDFLGPKDCVSCGGRGIVCISPQGRVADYPGGPFRGYATHTELEAARPIGD